MRIKFDLIQLNPHQNSSISLPLAPQLFLEITFCYWSFQSYILWGFMY